MAEYIQLITKGCKGMYLKYSGDDKFMYIKASDMEGICKAYNKVYPHWKACSVYEYTANIALLNRITAS
jgi:hypothetical protein